MRKIYTKNGDKGYTKDFNGKKLFKSDLRIKALGSIDELNSFCGLIISFSYFETSFSNIKKTILKIQNDLFIIQSILGGSNLKLNIKKVNLIEKNIDKMTNEMPKLNKFIIPSGIISANIAHIARSVCRRAEREITDLVKSNTNLLKDQKFLEILKYINRLSDFFFVLARYINYKNNYKEINPKY